MDTGVVLLPGHLLLFYSLEVIHIPYKSPDNSATSVPYKCHSKGVRDRQGGIRLWLRILFTFYFLEESIVSLLPPSYWNH